jgi:intermembrane space import and assembly protein 40
VDAIVEEKRKQLDEKLKARESHQATRKAETANSSATPQQTPPPPTDKPAAAAFASPEDAEKTPEQLEEEAGQQGAFNPETGEINWDCPCLGGMAHGPCGEEFKSAFSCFVYSDQEPKGIECIDKFQYVFLT